MSQGDKTPEERFTDYLISLVNTTQRERNRTRLLVRELLDNHSRVETAGTWYLKSFLENLEAMLRTVPGWEDATDTQTIALIYQLLGAINYYAISGPTFIGIFGKERTKALDKDFQSHFKTLIRSALNAHKRTT